MNQTPASVVIEAFGGARAVGRALAIQHTSVLLWDKPRPGGSGGLVPSSHHVPLLRLARERGLDLTENDLIWGRGGAVAA